MGDLSKVDYAANTAAPGSVFYKPQVHYSPAHVHHVDLPPELMKLYKQLEKEAVLELDKDPIMAANGGAKSMMCWQMANGAIYRVDELGRQFTEELHSAKVDKLVELLYGINSNTIVTYYFKHDLARIRARLEKEGIDYAVLAGSKTERTVERWNEGRTSVLLLHPQSAGHGLNLQFGGHSFVWFTMLWSLERYLQTNARLARSGQLGVVGIHSIIARNTTDEMMAINLGLNGDDQTRFRQALRGYQELRGMGLFDPAPRPFEGVGL
jgi:SNF2 family DNA or RNA helicase